jgi:hypothetical protein
VPDLLIARSARPTTVVGSVSLLFPGVGSPVVVVPVAVLLRIPAGAFWSTLTTRVNVALAPAARVAIEQVIVPFAPTAGAVQPKAGPASWVIDTKVVPAGSESDRATVWASDGPLLLIDRL